MHFHHVFVRTMILAGATVFLMSALSGLGVFAAPLPFALLWIAAPQGLRWLNAAYVREEEEPMPESTRRYLRSAARDTWRYFDDVADENHWLPPDNLGSPRGVAERTRRPISACGWPSAFGEGLWLRDIGSVCRPL
jgi:cyclic beta-1,2-glucan synthetase